MISVRTYNKNYNGEIIFTFNQQKLQEDVNKHKEVVDSLKWKAEMMIEDHSSDDTQQMKKQLERLTNRWSILLNRSVSFDVSY